jgi:hypothetical protein
MALRLRRGTEADRPLITPQQGEIIYVTDTKKIYVGDGATIGGVLVGPTLLEESNPQLGGNLNLNGRNIVGTGNINITGNITATGNINLGDNPADNINVGGLINSSLTPAIDDSYNLGTINKQWANVWATQVNIDTTLAVGSQIIKLSGGSGDSSLVLWDAETDTVTASNFVGDLTGSVFADDLSTLVDGLNKVFNGTVNTGEASLNQNSLTVENNNFSIGTPAKPLTLDLKLESNLKIQQVVGGVDPTGYVTTTVSRGTQLLPTAIQPGDELGGLLFRAYSDTETSALAGIISFVVADDAVINGGDYIKSVVGILASDNTSQDEANAFLLDSAGVASSNAFVANKYMQLPVYANDTARLAGVPTPSKGMMVFMESGTAPSATNQMQVFNGTAWVNAS